MAAACEAGAQEKPNLSHLSLGEEGLASRHEVEFKVTLEPNQADAVRELLQLTERKARRTRVRFYDTPQRDLLQRGVVLRTRQMLEGSDEVTVKLRPVDIHCIDSRWFNRPGFKVEADRWGAREVPSASFTLPLEPGRIEEVDQGKKGLGTLFSAEQVQWVAELTGEPLDFQALSILGPVESRKWKSHPKQGPGPLTIEEWALPQGRQLLEVSIRTPSLQSEDAARALSSYLGRHGIRLTSPQESKSHAAFGGSGAPALPSRGPRVSPCRSR